MMKIRLLAISVLVASLALAPGVAGSPVAAQRGAGNVELVGQIGGAVYAVAVQGWYAYIGVGPRLVILNVSDPAQPAVVGESSVLPGLVHGVAVAGSYAYVADDGGAYHPALLPIPPLPAASAAQPPIVRAMPGRPNRRMVDRA